MGETSPQWSRATVILGTLTALFGLLAALAGAFGLSSSQAESTAVQNVQDISGQLDAAQRKVAADRSTIELLRTTNNDLQGQIDGLKAELERVRAQVPSAPPSPDRGTAPQPSAAAYEFEFADRTYFDFDKRKASIQPTAADEVGLNSGRFFFGRDRDGWAKTSVVYIPSSEASRQGCEQGTDLKQAVAHLNELEQDESICVATSEGKWAVLTMTDEQPSNSGNIMFSVQMF